MAEPQIRLNRDSSNQNSRSDILRINSESQLRLLEYIKTTYIQQDDIWSTRSRFEDIDRSYLRQKDYTEEQRKAQAANRGGDPTKLQNIQVPVVLESVENGVSFLSQVFLTEYPMFKFGTGPENEDIALMWNTLVGEDQVHFGWASEFNKAFRNAEKYNFAPIECDWDKNIVWKPKSGNGPGGVSLEQIIWEGNRIEAHDPYNTIYDTRVPISKVHTDGEFIGWIKHMSRTKVKRFIHSLGEDRLPNDVKAYESPNWDISYYTPDINPKATGRKALGADGSFNWTAWVTDEAQNKIKYRNMYTVVCIYARIMPYEFGIKAPQDQTPDIWKLIAINNVLVYAKPIVNAHDYLPMLIAQSQADNLDFQTDSNAETQQPFQEMISALWNAKLQSARRRVTDRMIYNPLLVDPDHINSPNPSAKIPIRASAYGRKLEEAVYQIPFHDENSQYWLQEVQGIAEWGMRAQGHNRVSMGQFQKGNKLKNEFNTVMANAGSRDRTKAIMWENNAMHPLKVMIRSNCLQFAKQTTRFNRKEGKDVEIDPIKLREIAAEFEVGDGLLPIERLIDGDTLQQAFSYLAQDPSVGAEYNKGDLFGYLMKMKGADQLYKFKKKPEVVQYEQALGAWRSVAEILAKNPNYDPAQIEKALGPMPQPPQTQQQVNQNANTQT